VNPRASIAALAIGLALAAQATPTLASDVGYIYGRVVTTDGDAYEGQIRWGKEESFWDDIFNATKVENENLEYVDKRVLRRNRLRHITSGDFMVGANPRSNHVFATRFGDLKRIEMRRGDHFVVEFRNGEKLRLEGGSNDVGATVTVLDPEQGRHSLAWNKLRSVEFRPTPERLEEKLGEPIYGTVKSGKYDFEGRIQWDEDETLTVDRLDGQTRNGKVELRFGDIASIRKHRAGALVTLASGREHYVYGTNDVNRENRGVIVVVARLGSVKIGWADFDEVTFSRAPTSGRGYDEYGPGRDLIGTVTTRNGRHDGRIVYDLDESWDFELLQGTNGDTEYRIPFRDIARITPQGSRGADVHLKMGLTIELDDSQDVSRRNDGLLVFAGANDDDPTYVAWRDVREVAFEARRERAPARR
jgi:hypothetical protein